MRHPLTLAAPLLLMTLLLGACSSGPKIIANQDPVIDFTQYKTFSFVDPLSTDRAGVSGVVSGFLLTSTQAELEARGLTRAADPDLLVDFFVTTSQQYRASAGPSTAGYVHRGYGRYGTWGGYSMSASTTSVTQSTEGTVAIDIIDRRLEQIVWEGAAKGRVKDQTRENLDKAVPMVVAELFAQFPVPRTK